MIIHGWLHSTQRYRKLKDDINCDVTLVELAGFGNVPPRRVNYVQLVRQELLRTHYDVAIGHSMGGNILIKAINELNVDTKVILLSPVYGGLPKLKPLSLLFPLFPLVRSKFLIKCLSRLTVGKWSNIDSLMIEDVLRADSATAIKTLQEMVWDTWRVKSDLAMLVLVGSKDKLVSMDRLLEDFPNAKVVYVPNVSHTLVVENYELLLKTIKEEQYG